MKRFSFLVIFGITTSLFFAAHGFILRAFVPLATQQSYLGQMDDTYEGFIGTQVNYTGIVNTVYYIVLIAWMIFGIRKLIKLSEEK